MFYEVNNNIWQKEIESLADDAIFNLYKDSVFLITGATGFIGSWLVFSLICANRIKGLNNKVVALVRNKDKAEKIFKNVINDSNLEIIVQDISETLNYNKSVDYIVHCANITDSKTMQKFPVEVIETTIYGTKNILNFAKENNVKSVVYLSSIEIYGEQQNENVKEDEYGTLDSSIIRNCYPISKKMAENLCCSYSSEYGLDVKIARLTQTFGSGISKDDNRMFAQFAKCIIKNEDIVLKTDGLSYKNYCYITDAIVALLIILKKGERAGIYNVANYDSAIAVKDLALKLIKKYNSSSLRFDLDENNPYFGNVYLKLNCQKLESLGWKAKVNLDIMFEKLIQYLKAEGI